MAELLAIGITWWYTYQSYRIRRGVDLGKTISSLLLYNGRLAHEFSLSIVADMMFAFQEASIFCVLYVVHASIHELISVTNRCLATLYIVDIIPLVSRVRYFTAERMEACILILLYVSSSLRRFWKEHRFSTDSLIRMSTPWPGSAVFAS